MRLGVVLSIAWLVGVLAFTGYQYREMRLNLMGSIDRPNPELKGWELIGKQALVIDCAVHDKRISCHLRADNLALLAFGPIVLIWLVAYALVATYAWVRAGFVADKTEK